MKTIYFVRHGESEGNVSSFRLAKKTSLTSHGIEQASCLADRIQKLPIDMIFSSTMQRAKETTAIIKEKTNKPIYYSDIFVERRRPSVQKGRPKDDIDALASIYEIDKNFAEDNYRHSDEENFDDLKERARVILQTLEAQEEEHILVVTHGFIMRIVLAYMIFGTELTGSTCSDIIRTCHMQNTGITVFGHDETKEKPWWLWAWNDYAHLADLSE